MIPLSPKSEYEACLKYLSTTENNPNLVGRKTVLLWVRLIEEHWREFDLSTLSDVVKRIHHVWTIQRDEPQQFIELQGMPNHSQKFPVFLLLQYGAFRNILSKKVIKFKQTSILVLRVFEKYLFDKELPKENMSPHLWAQFLQIAVEIGDTKLIVECNQKAKGIPYTYVPYAFMGRSYLEEKQYKEAVLNFENASKSPFFVDDLPFCQAILGLLKGNEELTRFELIKKAEKRLKKVAEKTEIQDELNLLKEEIVLSDEVVEWPWNEKGHLRTKLLEADQMLKEGKIDECKWTLQALRLLYPYETEILKKLGDAYIKKGKFKKGNDYYVQAQQQAKSSRSDERLTAAVEGLLGLMDI